MFRDQNGRISSTKIMSFIGFFSFLITSALVIWLMPEKFNYELYAVLTGGGAVGGRIIDKYLNIKANKNNNLEQGIFPPLPEHPAPPMQKG